MAGHLHLLGGLFDVKELLVISTPQILVSVLVGIVALSMNANTHDEFLIVISVGSNLVLPLTYILMTLATMGSLVRLSHSMRDTGMLEMFLNQGIGLSPVMLSLWASYSLKYSLYMIVVNSVALLSPYLFGRTTIVELLIAAGVVAMAVSLLSSVCVTLSIILSPSEVQYWSEMFSLFILGFLYRNFLTQPDSSGNFLRLLVSGYVDPTSLVGEALMLLFSLILLIELSEERGRVVEVD